MRGPKTNLWLVAMGLGAVWTVGCADEYRHPAADEAFEQAFRTQGKHGEQAEHGVDGVAVVGERPLDRHVFERYWRERRSLERERVIQEVVDREVAAWKGLDGLGELRDELALARKRAMVRVLLREAIEEEAGAETLDEQVVEQRMKKLRRQVGRPPGYRTSQITIGVPAEVTKRRGKGEPLSDAQKKHYERARAIAEEVRADFSGERVDIQAIYAVANRYRERLAKNEALNIAVNAHMKLAKSGSLATHGSPPEDWVVVEAFSDEAARLVEEEGEHRLSPVIESRFGAHLMIVEDILPAKVPDEEELREVAVSQLLKTKRNELLQQRMSEWGDGAELAAYPARLKE